MKQATPEQQATLNSLGLECMEILVKEANILAMPEGWVTVMEQTTIAKVLEENPNSRMEEVGDGEALGTDDRIVSLVLYINERKIMGFAVSAEDLSPTGAGVVLHRYLCSVGEYIDQVKNNVLLETLIEAVEEASTSIDRKEYLN